MGWDGTKTPSFFHSLDVRMKGSMDGMNRRMGARKAALIVIGHHSEVDLSFLLVKGIMITPD